MKKLLITVNGKRYEVDVEVIEDDELIQAQPVFRPMPRTMDSYVTPVSTPLPGRKPAAGPAATGNGNDLHSPINGTVMEILVSEGDTVDEGAVVLVVEAMKMKTNISSPRAGVINKINVKVKDVIEQGQVLLTYK